MQEKLVFRAVDYSVAELTLLFEQLTQVISVNVGLVHAHLPNAYSLPLSQQTHLLQSVPKHEPGLVLKPTRELI